MRASHDSNADGRRTRTTHSTRQEKEYPPQVDGQLERILKTLGYGGRMPRKRADSKQLKLAFPESTDSLRLREENSRLRAENERLQAQMASLIEEISRLRQFVTTDNLRLTTYNNTSPHVPPSADEEQNLPPLIHQVTKRSTISEKVALFRSYFRGRDDAYAVRGRNGVAKLRIILNDNVFVWKMGRLRGATTFR